MTRATITFAGAAALLLAGAAPASAQDLSPFRMPWNDASPGPTDRAPAGDGLAPLPITVGADGHLYRDGERFRLWGMNFGFRACFPEHDQADAVAARLAKLGFNIVRLHGCDSYFGARTGDTLLDYTTDSSTAFDPDALDRYDYFIAALRRHGLYVDLNLYVARRFLPGDSPDPADPLPLPPVTPGEVWSVYDMEEHKTLGFFVDRVTEAQRRFARDLLGHVNPYTGLSYAEDPAVAIVEILNEGGLVHFWLWDRLDALPAPLLVELGDKWNGWLRDGAGYATTAELMVAWGGAEPPLELLENRELALPLDPWELPVTAPAVAGATVDPTADSGAPALRIDVSAAGTEAWHVQLLQSGLALVPGETYAARLRARASSARPVSFNVLLADDPWTTFAPWTERNLTTEWQELWTTFTVPEGPAPGEVRFELGMLGLQTGTVWVSQPSLTQGAAPLEPGETVEAGTIPLVAHDSPRAWSPAARRDFVAFLRDTERAYYDALASTLRDELGIRALISGSQVITSPPTVQAALDVVDNHAYWDNMTFPREPWDPVDWTITNTSVVGSPPGIFGTLASGRVAGKPYIVSETNHLAPNIHASEGPLITAAYAALQDFDGVFFFQWSEGRDLDHPTFQDWTDTGYHAPLLASLAAAAPLFQGFDVSPAAGAFTVAMDPDVELEAIVDAGVDWNVVDARCRGFPAAAALLGRVELDVSPGAVDSPVPDLAGQTRFVSDTGELVWDAAAGVVTIDSARARAVIGRADGGSFALGGPGLDCAIQPEACVTFEIGATRRGFCALALTLLEGASFGADGRALLSATGDVENTGMIWTDASRTSVGDDWGGAPTLVEVIPAVVTLPRAASEVRVFALDGRGQRAAELPVTGDGTAATFELGQELDTLWYEVALGAVGEPPGDGESSLTACAAVCDAAAAAVPGCHPRRADCLSDCGRLYVELRSAPCDCAEAADSLLACAAAAPAALACSELPLGLDPAGDCLDELVAAEQCAGAVRPCVAYERELIDDFEDGDARALHPEFGAWAAAGDTATTLAPVPFTPTAGGVHASAHAARLEGDVAEWAQLRVAARGGAPVDLSAYAGIAFYARGPGVTRVVLPGSALAAAENWDAHGMDLSLGGEWRYFTVLFADRRFAQQGWGDPAPFDPAAIDQLHFEHGPGSWQLEVDDVTLLRDPNAGPVGGAGGAGGAGAAGAAVGGAAPGGAAQAGGAVSAAGAGDAGAEYAGGVAGAATSGGTGGIVSGAGGAVLGGSPAGGGGPTGARPGTGGLGTGGDDAPGAGGDPGSEGGAAHAGAALGTGGAGASGPESPGTGGDRGCGCRLPVQPPAPGSGALALLAALALLRRRRWVTARDPRRAQSAG